MSVGVRTRGLALATSLALLSLLAAACSPATGGPTVEAVVARSNNLFVGSDVRVLGMRVGRVSALAPDGVHVRVTMRLDDGVRLPAGARAEVQPTSLLGERFVALTPYTSGPELPDGALIPLERTSVPAETDEVLASFERFLEGLDPDTIAELVDVVAETIEGQGQGLNALIDEGGDTIRVLADSSDDLMAAVSALADLSETMAVRDRRITKAIEDWSSVVGVLGEESDQVVEGVGNLRRLVGELRPLLDEHAEPLSADLVTLTTALGTVDRNLDRLGRMLLGSHTLFDAAGRAFEYEHAQLKLVNVGNELPRHIAERIAERLVGLCLRLAEPVCANEAFWQAHVPAVLCWDGVVACTEGRTRLREAFRGMFEALPPSARARLAEEARERQAEPEDPSREPLLRLPLPDGRLELGANTGRSGLLDRLSRLLGGAR